MTRAYQRHRDIDDTLLIEICDRFLNGKKSTEIAEWLTVVLRRNFTRQAVYPLISRALERRFIRLHPPPQSYLRQRISDLFRVDRNEIHVVDAQGENVRDLVADATARQIVNLIKDVGETKDRVRIGLGGGGTISSVSRSLASYLRKESDLPSLAFHALTPGFDVMKPHTAPISSFGYFDGIADDTEFVGLFAPAVVLSDDYDVLISSHGVRESFELAKDIDIVVTSCARAKDEHGELKRFIEVSSPDGKKTTSDALREAGWLADIIYRPFGKTGPIELDHGIRSVTLFELENLVAKVSDEENKHVVLVAAPCGECGEAKVEALRPLLTHQSLKLWNHLFLDTKTAKELVSDESRDHPGAIPPSASATSKTT